MVKRIWGGNPVSIGERSRATEFDCVIYDDLGKVQVNFTSGAARLTIYPDLGELSSAIAALVEARDRLIWLRLEGLGHE